MTSLVERLIGELNGCRHHGRDPMIPGHGPCVVCCRAALRSALREAATTARSFAEDDFGRCKEQVEAIAAAIEALAG